MVYPEILPIRLVLNIWYPIIIILCLCQILISELSQCGILKLEIADRDMMSKSSSRLSYYLDQTPSELKKSSKHATSIKTKETFSSGFNPICCFPSIPQGNGTRVSSIQPGKIFLKQPSKSTIYIIKQSSSHTTKKNCYKIKRKPAVSLTI